MFENRVLRGIFGSRRRGDGGDGEDCITKSFMIYTVHQNFSGEKLKEDEISGACSTYGDRRCAYGVYVMRPEVKTSFGLPGVGGRIILKWVIKKYNRMAETALTCLRTGASGRLL